MSAAKPYATMSASKLAETTKPLEWLVDGLFIKGGAAILGGPPKLGKSILALDLCVAVASGTSGAGDFMATAPMPVVLLAAEDPPAVVVSRLAALARARGRGLATLPIEVIVEPGVRLPEGLVRLAATLEMHRPGLLLLDPLIRIHAADENSSTEMSVILDGLRQLARCSMTSILVVHHARKAPPGAFPGAGLRGSSDLAAAFDTNIYVKRLAADAAIEIKIEHRAAPSAEPVRLRLAMTEGDDATARFEHLDKPQDPVVPKVLSILEDAPGPLSTATVREKLGLRNQAVGRALQVLAEDGRVQRKGRDGWVLVHAT